MKRIKKAFAWLKLQLGFGPDLKIRLDEDIPAHIRDGAVYIIGGADDTNKEPHELLSNREYQILLLIASGETVTAIAEMLCLSAPTISTYRTRMLGKMNLKNNAELTAYAVNKKLL